MKHWMNKFLLLFICNMGSVAHGEDIWFPTGKRPIASISEKIQRSMKNAFSIAEGRFTEVQPNHTLRPIDDTKGVLESEFEITDPLGQGKPIGSTIRLQLIVYRPLPTAGSNADKSTLSRSLDAERVISGDTVNFQQYLNELARARPQLLSAPNYLQEFFLVPIAVGGLDAPYRVTDIVVRLRKKYIIFFMRDIANPRGKTLFPSDWDIYDAEEPEVIAALKHAGYIY